MKVIKVLLRVYKSKNVCQKKALQVVSVGPADFVPILPATGGMGLSGFAADPRVGAQWTLDCGASNWKEWIVSVLYTGLCEGLCCQLLGLAWCVS